MVQPRTDDPTMDLGSTGGHSVLGYAPAEHERQRHLDSEQFRSAPSIAQTLLALGLDYMALAARLGQPAEMQQDPAGFGD